ncbi:2-C-methyl-D-erythritol 4-phosphate cytidylyltransferase [Candidatus Omnitrophota bacterium]
MGKAEALVEVVIVAAGKGTRIKSKTTKPFIVLQNKPLLFYSLKTFQNHLQIKSIILVVGKPNFKKAWSIINKYKLSKIKCIVQGGEERKDSVINGLSQIDKSTKFVLIHDAARPFVSKDLITKILKALKEYKAAVPGIPVQDTLKRTDKKTRVVNTLEREYIHSIQTPQGLRTEILPLLFKNYRKSKSVYDDVMLIEGEVRVKVVSSSPKNFKITTPDDLRLARFYLSQKK